MKKTVILLLLFCVIKFSTAQINSCATDEVRDFIESTDVQYYKGLHRADVNWWTYWRSQHPESFNSLPSSNELDRRSNCKKARILIPVVERRIGKVSPYAEEVETMQQQLISCYEKMGDMAEIKIDSKNLKRYLEIAHSQEGMLSVVLLKAYIALNGKRDVKDKADRLFKRIKKSVDQGKITKSDKYADKLNEAYQTLKSYIDGDSLMLNINKAQLNGLMGILGEDLFQKKSLNGHEEDNGMIVSSGELLAMDFQTIGLQGKYKQLIGDPSVGFTAMVYGLPKSGKSTMCLDFANYLASHHGKVLYCAIEEGFGYTLKEKIERLKAHHSNLYITDGVPENLNDFQFVFIDSVSKAGMDVNAIDQLRKMHPDTSFIFIYHTTKEGNFKGVNEHAHEVDVIVQVDKGKATSTGRFNAGGSMEI